MTPQQIKARELVEKFMYELMVITNVRDRYPIAKACAIICVDEIIDALNTSDNIPMYAGPMGDDEPISLISFYLSVREEIVKL